MSRSLGIVAVLYTIYSIFYFQGCDSQFEESFGPAIVPTPRIKGGPKLNILKATEHEIHVEWSHYSDLPVEKYQISASPLETHGDIHAINRHQWSFSTRTNRTQLMGLHPGTLYNVSLCAVTKQGETDLSMKQTWTEIGAPEIPSSVEVIQKNGRTMNVNIPNGYSSNGPITSYRLIVFEKNPLVVFNFEDLADYNQAQGKELPFYVTAELTTRQANQTFTIGDEQFYHGYYNAPLLEEKDYEILVGVVSSFNGIVKIAYSQRQPSDESQDMLYGEKVRTSSMLSVALSAAIGVFGFLLVLSVVIYFLLRKHYGRRRPSDELVLRDHGSQADENGFLPGGLHIDDDTDLSEFYDQLKEHYWQIPKSQLGVLPTVLGIGQFGEVREATVHRRAQNLPCLIQHSQSPSVLGEKEKRSLLKELDIQARTGFHPNVVEFFGACDERGILHVAIEHHSTSLRGLLLRSRQTTNGVSTNLSEFSLFEIAAGVAQGMSHLADRGILHKHLSSRNVLITSDTVPKIANFGLGYYNPLGQKFMYRRWTAPEVMNSNTFTSKSDVWSFGVLLWEIFTLGASPYTHVLPRELLSRITQGLRLPKPNGASQDLYQLMLHCWELDAQERPNFLELCSDLQTLLLNAKEHFNVKNLELLKFDPNAEED